jgi:hypothetical protein
MNLYAPNVALFVISGCLAFIGVMASLPIELPIPGIVLDNSALYIFLGWFLLAVGSVLPPRNAGASRPNGPEPSSR